MSRHQAPRQGQCRQLIDQLRAQGIVIRSHSNRGVPEEAPGAYKDVGPWSRLRSAPGSRAGSPGSSQ